VRNQVSHPHKTGEDIKTNKDTRKKAEEIKALRSKIKTDGILTDSENLIGKWGG
jgi:hypothetical protein